MRPTVFQKAELRDENDNIIQQGTYGKGSALSNSTNDGWIDYVMNNLEALYGIAKDEVVPVSALPASGDMNKTYLLTTTGVCYRWDGTAWVEISSSEAVGRAETAANLAEQWATKTDGSVADNEYSAKYYANAAQQSADDAQDVADDMADHLAQIDENTGDISRNTKDIANVKKLLEGNLYDYDTDTDSAYVKTVPTGVLPYASIDKLGGKAVVWNQLVDSGTTTVATISGHKYYTMIDGTASIITADGTAISVVDDTADMVCDLTLLYGVGNEPSTVAEFESMFPAEYYAYSTPTLLSAGVTQVDSKYKTLLWNQLLQNGNFADGTNGWTAGNNAVTLSASNGVLTVTNPQINTNSYWGVNTSVSIKAGHKYFVRSAVTRLHDGTSDVWNSFNIQFDGVNVYTLNTSSVNIGVALTMKEIVTATSDATNVFFGYAGYIPQAKAVDVFAIQRVQIFDLTAMFGAGNEPTVQRFEQIFPNPFYVYNAGQEVPLSITLSDGLNAALATPVIIQSVAVPAEVQALDGYGWSAGTAYNYIDYERRKFVKKVDRVDLGTQDYFYTVSGNSGWFSLGLPTMKYGVMSDATASNILCTNFATASFTNMSSFATDKVVSARNNDYVQFYDTTAGTDTAAFKTAMSGVYLYYELATPQEVDISEYINDSLIEVKAEESLCFPNINGADYPISVPSQETYMIDLSV